MYDAEMPTVYSCELRTAKKPHQCCECRKAISPGDQYQFFKGCYDGKWAKYKTCKPCADLRDEMASQDGEAPPFEELHEAITEANR
jgi:predicted  nucleic acid-binding Zn-ribbon protein